MLLPGAAEGQKSGATTSSREKENAFGAHPGLKAEQFHNQNGSQVGASVETITALCGGRVACTPLPQGCLFRCLSTRYLSHKACHAVSISSFWFRVLLVGPSAATRC